VKEKIMMEGIHTEKCTTMEKEKNVQGHESGWQLRDWRRGRGRNEEIVVQKA
jgi:hypothetical protein